MVKYLSCYIVANSSHNSLPWRRSSEFLGQLAAYTESSWLIWFVMLCCLSLVQQAAIGNCLPFDPFPFDQDNLASPKVDVGGRQVACALVVSQIIVIGDEGLGMGFEIAKGSTSICPNWRLPNFKRKTCGIRRFQIGRRILP